MRRQILKFVIFLGDVVFLFLSLLIVLYVRYGAAYVRVEFADHLGPFSLIFAVWVTVFYITDLYNFSVPLNHKYFLYAMAVNLGLAVGFFYAFPGQEISPKTNLALVVLCFGVFFYVWRFIFNRSLDTLGIKKPLIIVGSDTHALELAQKIKENSRLGYRLAAIVRDNGTELPAWVKPARVRVLDRVTDIHDLLQHDRVHSIIVSDRKLAAVYDDLYQLIPYQINFFQLTTFWEAFDESIPIYAAQATWFLERFSHGPNRAYRILKRILDIGTVIVTLPVTGVLALITALLVRLTSRGPIFYIQTRLGQSERPFTIVKFRSMVVNAEQNGAQWAGENDPRVTPFGRFMRKTRLDEIPQLINVLRGDMSVVGPRPERPEFVQELSRTIPHYHLRHLVKPGLTGWAQIKYRYGASAEDAAKKLMYDLYYVKNVSVVLDVKIALKTVLVIFKKAGQ